MARVSLRQAKTAVCNLTVPGLHTFAVGEAQVLVHNTSNIERVAGLITDILGLRSLVDAGTATASEELALRAAQAELTAIEEALATGSGFSMFAGGAGGTELGIYGDLTANGMIEFYIGAGSEAVPRGHVLFQAMINYFGTRARGVIGSWTYGTNLAKFNELTAQRLTFEQAVAGTWTGIQALENGFRTVTIIGTPTGTPGAYTRVLVEFTR